MIFDINRELAEWEEDEPGEELVSEDEEVDGKDEEDEDQEDVICFIQTLYIGMARSSWLSF
jgi:hypothetical protein